VKRESFRGRLAQEENELIIGLLRSRAQSENRTTKDETSSCVRSTMNSIFNDPGFWHRLQFGFTITYHSVSAAHDGAALFLVYWKWRALRNR